MKYLSTGGMSYDVNTKLIETIVELVLFTVLGYGALGYSLKFKRVDTFWGHKECIEHCN